MDDKKLAIFQNDSGAIELSVDMSAETIWATQKQLASVFNVDVRTINEHLQNIFSTSELAEAAVVRKIRITAADNKTYNTKHYNLDAIISVGYRVNSKQATAFRKWATKTLRSYIADGFTINPVRIERNKSHFLQAIDDLKLLATKTDTIGVLEVVDLTSAFANTWFSLDAYDKSLLPTEGNIQHTVTLGADDLQQALMDLRTHLINRGEATEIFGLERTANGISSLFSNVFQSFDGKDVYPSLEEKAAQLLYFTVKNHVFVDGNKRSGAYAFIWFLQKVGLLNITEISPQALTAITLLVAESDPKDKDRLVGLVLLLLGAEKRTA